MKPELPQTIGNMWVYPAQSPPWLEDSEDAPGVPARPEFVRDKNVYDSSNPYPQWSYQEEASQIGNLHVLSIRVSPTRFLPAERQLILARRLRVQVKFSGLASPSLPAVLGIHGRPGANRGMAGRRGC